MAKRPGICGTCWREVAINGDGNVRGHRSSPPALYPRNEWCAGSRLPPAAIIEDGIVKPVPEPVGDSTRQ